MDVTFERRGSGPTLVLLHGIGHHWRAWEPVIDLLAVDHDVIAVDLPGFGASPPPVAGMPDGMAAVVASVAELFTGLGLDRPHVAGNSLGGGIALELAAADLVASATAFSPAGFGTPREMRLALALLRAHRAGTYLPRPVMRWALRSGAVRAVTFGRLMSRPGRLTAERAYADACALRAGKAFGPVARAGPTYAYAGRPSVPVTIAWGTRDRILPYRQAGRARAQLPGARHVDLPGCGHVPMADDPGLIAAVIRETTTHP